MPIKILVADDATFVRDMIKRALRQMLQGVELFEAPDGARARTLIKQKNPTLILSDWEMPVLSGEELLRWVRGNPDTQATPFIMITSRGDRDHVMAAVKAGVNDYISKPFSPDELTRKVAKQLKKLDIPLGPGVNPDKKASAYSSLGVLTGGNPKTLEPDEASSSLSSANAAGVSPSDKTPPAQSVGLADKTSRNQAFKGRAVIRFASREPQDCMVREASLQSIGGFLVRSDKIPVLFEQAVVDLADAQANLIATLNGYVHSVTAVEPTPASRGIKIVVRFVDEDPEKLAALAQHLS
ncbi:MAG TPA: response regulator [Marinagarivorans sp.]